MSGMNSDLDNVMDGLRSAILDCHYSNFSSKDFIPPKAQHVLVISFFSKIVQDMEVKFDMTTRQKIVLGCWQEKHAQYFHLDIPIDGLGQHMSYVEYRTIFDIA